MVVEVSGFAGKVEGTGTDRDNKPVSRARVYSFVRLPLWISPHIRPSSASERKLSVSLRFFPRKRSMCPEARNTQRLEAPSCSLARITTLEGTRNPTIGCVKSKTQSTESAEASELTGSGPSKALPFAVTTIGFQGGFCFGPFPARHRLRLSLQRAKLSVHDFSKDCFGALRRRREMRRER